MSQLKAYDVREPVEGHCVIRFASNSATARRKGANELGIEWESVEHCRRIPILDEFVPGPARPSALIDLGRWLECWHCGNRVDDYDKPDIIYEGAAVYCSMWCRQMEFTRKRRRGAAHVVLIELFESQFSDYTIKHIPCLRRQTAAT
ncbi:hypothetical protein GTP45_11750 [Pseudoduganella sp. FT55W]|uniref:Uncharacterized protein n=1 Tax=Duganella rivi TaxID=2666083 RepID=A0A7X4GR10_9BURK|nr:hypothetical protein [Duganella rivi]MYM67501.1 hypothetical protein [Duganella rivi]